MQEFPHELVTLCPKCHCNSTVDMLFFVVVSRCMVINQCIKGSLEPCITIPLRSIVRWRQYLHWYCCLLLSNHTILCKPQCWCIASSLSLISLNALRQGKYLLKSISFKCIIIKMRHKDNHNDCNGRMIF